MPPNSSSSSDSETSWLINRLKLPNQFRQDDSFTDVELRVSGRSFRAHRLILCCHCEFFLNLFRSGMRETKEGVVEIKEVEADVFRMVLEYIYEGEIEGELTFEMTRSLLMTANMWQMVDLEEAVLRRLAKVCTPQRCLKIFLFINSGSEGGLFAEDHPVKQQVEKVLCETVKDRWHLITSPSNHLDSIKDDYIATLVDLDLESLKTILSIKSVTEEISDFSFSFNQTDLCLAVVQWVKFGLVQRWQFLKELSVNFCQHQINANATVALGNLVSEIAAKCNVSLELNLDSCTGTWCPKRRISGLVVTHAWSPSPHNRITSDHIFYYFAVSKAISSSGSFPLLTDTLYDLGLFGDLGDGERHLHLPNSCLSLHNNKNNNNNNMILTFDNGTLSGTVVDPVSFAYQCGFHHSDIYRYCPSNISECKCDFEGRMSICGDRDSGRVFVLPCLVCQKEESSYDPCCETFVMISPPPEQMKSRSIHNDFSVASSSGLLYNLGGHLIEPGNTFGYVYCTYDLQEFGNYKSGHAHIKTGLGYLKDTPLPNMSCFQYDLTTKTWSEGSMRLPSAISDAASIVVGDNLFLIGGFEVCYDGDLQLFYQKPLKNVWIFSFSENVWKRGPDLPYAVTRGTAFDFQGKIIFSGGAGLRVNEAKESNQIYEYVTNTKVFCLSEERWDLVLDLGTFYDLHKSGNYSVLSVFPADVTLPKLRLKKDNLGEMKFAVKSFTC